jgi:hypothetical protein
MSSLTSIDLRLINDLFKLQSGYVLDFTNSTFRQLFADDLNLNIEDEKYAVDGNSKAKRLRRFLKTADNITAAKALKILWAHREAMRLSKSEDEWIPNSQTLFSQLIGRLEGTNSSPSTDHAQKDPPLDQEKFLRFKNDFKSMLMLSPQQRGYAFEKFLKELFTAFGMEAREPFRLRGEQIDGSFILGNETYLIEAKWQNERTGVAELHGFHGKLEQKAAWTRGVFISYSGFTDEGLAAFGKGKRVVCVDGLDIHESLHRSIPMPILLERKVRGAAESGQTFIGIRELFP